MNRAADGASRGVLCKYNSDKKRKSANQNEVGNQAHDAVARKVFWNVSQGDWQMQLWRAVLANSGEVRIPEGKRVANQLPSRSVAQSLSQSLSLSVLQFSVQTITAVPFARDMPNRLFTDVLNTEY